MYDVTQTPFIFFLHLNMEFFLFSETLPLDRIFQMLRMFAMQGQSSAECDIEELRSFLDDKVRQHELLFSGGQYKLPNS